MYVITYWGNRRTGATSRWSKCPGACYTEWQVGLIAKSQETRSICYTSVTVGDSSWARNTTTRRPALWIGHIAVRRYVMYRTSGACARSTTAPWCIVKYPRGYIIQAGAVIVGKG